MAAAMSEVRRAVDAALAAAGRRAGEIAAAFYALAGADLEEDFAILRPAVAELGLGGKWDIDNDTIAGLWAGTSARDAVVVILGAGTNAAGRNSAGQEIRLPGLGWISGDWGGGGDLAREAVSEAMRAWDGRGEPTALTDVLLEALGCADMGELLLKLYREQIRGTRLLGVVPLIFDVAAAGDAVARRLVERQAAEAAIMAGALIGRLGMGERSCDVVLAGSVSRERTGELRRLVQQDVLERYPQARVVVSTLEPVLGAALRAMDLIGLDTGETVRQRLAESYVSPPVEGS
jgi:N-acetylglucosamine kinase-like BadF-type ATPase